MEFPVDNLDAFPSADFDGSPNGGGKMNVELLAQIWDNGRVMDHWRLSVGGSSLHNVMFPMTTMVGLPALAGWRLSMQFWPRDVHIRRNMTSSIWVSVNQMIAAREAQIIDDNNKQIPSEAVLTELQANSTEASVRWAIVIGEDEKLRLHLQSLPASAVVLSSKPSLRG